MLSHRATNYTPFRNTCAPQKVDPALIARVRPTIVGCFWPVFLRITTIATQGRYCRIANTTKTDPARLEARIYLKMLGPTAQICSQDSQEP